MIPLPWCRREMPETAELPVMAEDAHDLTGKYRVRVYRPAWADVDRWFKRTREKIEIRSQALKLRFWPDQEPADQAGRLLDVDWDWIRALSGHPLANCVSLTRKVATGIFVSFSTKGTRLMTTQCPSYGF